MVRHLAFVVTLLAIIGLGWVAAQQLPLPGQAKPGPTATVRPSPRGAPTPVPAISALTPIPGIPSLTLVPPSGPIAPGATFDVQVQLNSPVVTRGTQFGLSFDPNALAATGIEEGDYYRTWAQAHQASTILFPGVQVDAQKGWVEPLGIAVLGGPPTAGPGSPAMGGPSGSGRLATIHLRAKPGGSENALVTLQEVIVSTPDVLRMAVSVPSVQVTDAVVVVGSGAAGAQGKAPTPHLIGAQTPGPWVAPGYAWATTTPPPGFATRVPIRTSTAGQGRLVVVNGTPERLPPAVTSVPVTRDLDPAIAPQDKSQALIRFADGHEETWLVGPGHLLSELQAQLPPGAQILSVPGPPSEMGKEAPKIAPPAPLPGG